MDTTSGPLEDLEIALTSSFSAEQMARAALEMLNRAEHAMDTDPLRAKIFIGRASRLLERAPKSPARSMKPRGPGLAGWQERAVMRHIDGNLEKAIRVRQLAQVVGLSGSHFSRCFKGSFGVSPRDYLIRSRLERAKRLMRQSRSSLCQIALDSGFADQAHMSRLFHAIVGSTPTRWRRAQTSLSE